MKDLGERIATVESEVKSMKESVERFRDHISGLLTFQNQAQGSIKTIMWLFGFITLQGIATLVTVLVK